MDLPLITTISESRPLARTTHTCTVCGLPIAIGTRYSRHVISNDDALDRKHKLRVIKWHLPYCPRGEETNV